MSLNDPFRKNKVEVSELDSSINGEHYTEIGANTHLCRHLTTMLHRCAPVVALSLRVSLLSLPSQPPDQPRVPKSLQRDTAATRTQRSSDKTEYARVPNINPKETYESL